MNAIKMYIYKMIHSKSSLIILLAAVAMACFSIYMGKYESDYYKEHEEELAELEQKSADLEKSNSEEMNFGIMVDAPVASVETQPAVMEYVTADLKSGFFYYLCGAFCE